MMLKRSVKAMSVVLLLLVSMSAFAQTTVKPIPVYPGSQATTEMNLTDKDFLPVIRQWIRVIPSMLETMTQGGDVSPENASAIAEIQSLFSDRSLKDLEAAVRDLRSINVIGYRLPAGVDSAKVSNFYMQKLGLTKGWTLTFRFDQPGTSFRLYTKANFDGFLGLVVKDKDVTVFNTTGRIDVPAISEWFVKAVPVFLKYSTIQSVTSVQESEPMPPAEPGAVNMQESPVEQK